MEERRSIKVNATLNIIKTICSVVFPLITFPYATRILGTDNYGLYSFSASIISYISLIGGFGLASYATREGARKRSNKADIQTFVNQIFTLNILTTAIAYFILGVLLVTWDKLATYTNCILILSISIFFATIGVDWINIIFEDYKYITLRYIACYIIQIALLFILVRSKEDVLNYALVSVFSTVIANVLNVFYIRKKYKIVLSISATKDTIRHIFPAVVFFANSIVTIIYINSDITILGVLKGDYSVGIYSVASRIYLLVKQVIGAITAVIIPRMSALVAEKDEKSIENIYKGVVKTVLLILIPSVFGLFMEADNIVHLISGPDYIAASSPLRILSISLLFAVLSNIFINAILIPYRKEKSVLIITSVSAVVNIALNFYLIPEYDYNATAITTLIAEIIVFTTGLYVSWKIKKINAVKELIISSIGGITILLICLLGKFLFSDYLVELLFSVSISIIAYSVFLYIVKDNVIYNFIYKVIKLSGKL